MNEQWFSDYDSGQDVEQYEMMYEDDWLAARNSPFGLTEAEMDVDFKRLCDEIDEITAQITALEAEGGDRAEITKLSRKGRVLAKYGGLGEEAWDPDFWRKAYDAAFVQDPPPESSDAQRLRDDCDAALWKHSEEFAWLHDPERLDSLTWGSYEVSWDPITDTFSGIGAAKSS